MIFDDVVVWAKVEGNGAERAGKGQCLNRLLLLLSASPAADLMAEGALGHHPLLFSALHGTNAVAAVEETTAAAEEVDGIAWQQEADRTLVVEVHLQRLLVVLMPPSQQRRAGYTLGTEQREEVLISVAVGPRPFQGGGVE